jgi:hypothetical protein
MSTSSAEPDITIVVGSNGAPGSVERCLEALAPQVDGTEVLVCEPVASPEAVRSRFPFAHFMLRDGALVPELWRDGIAAAAGEAVVLTVSPMRVAPNWVTTARTLAAKTEAAGGAIEPDDGLRLCDAAEYFCRYARDMLPFEPHECLDLPGDNAVYRKDALERTRDVWAAGFWEPDVNRALRAQGAMLLHTPELVVHQGRSAGFWRFLVQRLHHGRAYGGSRAAQASTVSNAGRLVLAFLVPLVLLTRSAREISSRRRHRLRFLLSVPALLAYDAAWALGEAAGYAAALRRR